MTGSSEAGQPHKFDWPAGTQVVLRTTLGEDIKSTVFAYDPESSFLLLKEPGTHGGVSNLRFLKTQYIKDVVSAERPAGGVLPADLLSLPHVDAERGRRREERALRQAELEASRIGNNVTKEAQAMFDALMRTMPCHWQGTTIVVLDCVFVAEPYSPASCSVSDESNSVTLERVRKVLAASRLALGC